MTPSSQQLVGQSLMLSFPGPRIIPELREALARTHACGVILFAHNVEGPEQLRELTSELQSYAAELGLPPLLVAIDQEGGPVTRLPAPFVTVPSQMAQAATGDPQAAYECARVTAEQLLACGVNTNFAPVFDVNNNPHNPVIGTRSFGETPATVIELGLAALRGYRDAGVIATVKHFPGHGDTQVDSHLGLPVVAHDRERLDAVELAPFVAAFRAGVPALMSAHIVFEALDSDPATLSSAILTDLLRRELGFDGLVFTDALDMRAIAATYGPIEAALRSKAAGADVLLPLGLPDEQIEIAEALAAALEQGRLSHAAFAATAERLARLREAYRLDTASQRDPLDPRHVDVALDVARRSVTLVGSRDGLPLDRDARVALIDCMLPRFSLADEALEWSDYLRDLVVADFPRSQSLALDPEPDDRQVADAVALAERCDVVVLATRNAALLGRQLELARRLEATATPVVHAALRMPYDAGLVRGSRATLITYGDAAVSLRALVDVLAGRHNPSGKAPVTLPHLAGSADR